MINMNLLLNEVEVRILGCLIEKERTGPDYYPLTLNALTTACNQKSNRNPIVVYDESVVLEGMAGLSEKGLLQTVHGAMYRVEKYRHTFQEKYNLSDQQIAILCVLMLRGPQTVGEIKGRSERLFHFQNLEEVDAILQDLMSGENPWTIKLPRQMGRKDPRYMHLLSGEPVLQEEESPTPLKVETLHAKETQKRIINLEEELKELHREFDDLKKAFLDFKSQFD